MSGFGWELLLSSVKADLSSSNDVLVAFVHWKLMSVGLRSVGTGEHFTVGQDEAMSEVLPKQWNKNEDKDGYAIRYRDLKNEKDKYLVRAIQVEDSLVVSLIRIADEKVTTLNVKTDDNANEQDVTKKEELEKSIQTELLDPMFKKKEEEKKREGQDRLREPGHDPLRVGPPRRPGFTPPGYGGPGFPDYGARDLDPLGGGGGGMIFDPMGAGRGRGMMPNFDPVHPHNPFPGPGRGGGRGGGMGGGGNFGDEFGPPGFGGFM